MNFSNPGGSTTDAPQSAKNNAQTPRLCSTAISRGVCLNPSRTSRDAPWRTKAFIHPIWFCVTEMPNAVARVGPWWSRTFCFAGPSGIPDSNAFINVTQPCRAPTCSSVASFCTNDSSTDAPARINNLATFATEYRLSKNIPSTAILKESSDKYSVYFVWSQCTPWASRLSVNSRFA